MWDRKTMEFEAWRHIKEQLAPFFVDGETPCPYGLPHTAVYHQALFNGLPDGIVGLFFHDGFRRNGNVLYSMACADCRACIPIRVRPVDFKANRNQRRVWKKNMDVEVKSGSLEVTDEKLALCNEFLAARYPGKEGRAQEYYSNFFCNSVCTSMEVCYRLDGKLIGVAIADVGDQWLNAVYFYFDPRVANRSPGTFNILSLIDICKRVNIPWLYLGYWIDGVAAMDYKKNFKPHWLLQDGEWQQK